MKDKILVALSTFAEYGKNPLIVLQNSNIEYFINPLGRRLLREEIMDMGSSATGIVAGVEPYDEIVLKKLPNLKCISRAGVGVDNIDLEYAKNRNIIVRNTPEVVIRPVVELTLAMIFDLLRKTTFHTRILRNHRWEKSAGNLLSGKTVGIIGTGRIGKAVSEILIKLGAKITAFDISPDKHWAIDNNVHYVTFSQLLSSSDIISLHASPGDTKKPLLGKEEIRMMNRGVIIINTSRGDFIDEQELCDGLASGQVGSVGLDVFPKEPYNGKLMDFDNVVLTPHIATLTIESRLEMEVQATTNLISELKH